MPPESSHPSSSIPPVSRKVTANKAAEAPRTPPTPPRTPPETPRPSLRERAAQAKRSLTARARVVREFLHIPMIPLAGMAAFEQSRNPGQISPYALDIRTIEMHGDELAQAIADMGDAYPVLGAALDRIATVTPFMALATCAFTIGAQIAENHGKLPPNLRGAAPALIERDELALLMVQEAREMQSDSTLVMQGNGS